MKIGSLVPTVHSIELSSAAVAGASQLGLDSLWFPDHLLGFVHPALWPDLPASRALPDPDAFLDPFVTAGVVGPTTSLPIGTSVTDSAKRGGADLARAAMTLNDACRGGFILGIGAGEAESVTPFGYDFSTPIGSLERVLRDLRSLLDTGRMPGDSVGRTGLDRHGPKGIPAVWVAAQGPRALRLVGQYGDGWLTVGAELGQYTERLAAVRRAADSAGRPHPVAAMMPVTIFGESRAAVIDLMQSSPLIKLFMLFADGELWARYGVQHPYGAQSQGYRSIPHECDPKALRVLADQIPIELVERWIMFGNAQEIATRLEPFIDAGMQYLVCADFTGIAQLPEAMPAAMGQLAELAAILHGQAGSAA